MKNLTTLCAYDFNVDNVEEFLKMILIENRNDRHW